MSRWEPTPLFPYVASNPTSAMADRGNQTGEFYRKSGALWAGPLKRRDNAEVDRSCNNSWHSPVTYERLSSGLAA